MRLKLSWGKTGETMVDVDKPHSVTRCISFHQDYLSDLSNALIGPHRQVINFVHICCWTRLSHTDSVQHLRGHHHLGELLVVNLSGRHRRRHAQHNVLIFCSCFRNFQKQKQFVSHPVVRYH